MIWFKIYFLQGTNDLTWSETQPSGSFQEKGKDIDIHKINRNSLKIFAPI
jgi:hypothetical protein